MMISTGRQELSKAQFEAVKKAAAVDSVEFERSPADPNVAPDFLWQKGHILIDDDFPLGHPVLSSLGATLAKNLNGSPQVVKTGQVKLVKINGSALDAVGILKNAASPPRYVGVNNLISICPVNLCPADEPIQVRPWPHSIPYPAWDQGGTGGAGVYVKVIDTGLAEGWKINHPWLYDGSGTVTAQQLNLVSGTESTPYKPSGDIDLYAGHGEFIAGVLRCVAPQVRVNVSAALKKWAGAMTEYEVRNALMSALNETPKPDIISLSAGCTTMDGLAPRGLQEVVDLMKNDPNCPTLLVAAAGNDGSVNPFYPGAFAGDPAYQNVVVSVGALREDRLGRACFSNFGNWVSVYEEGERLVNAFPTGQYVYDEPLEISGTPPKPECIYFPGLETGCTCVTAFAEGTVTQFDGMASWSGTSFSTPTIAARIAKQMANPNTPSARQAWQALRSSLVSFTDAGDKITRLRRLA